MRGRPGFFFIVDPFPASRLPTSRGRFRVHYILEIGHSRLAPRPKHREDFGG